MLPKVVRTIFLALGLAMLWLGFFYQYELKKQPVQPVIVQEAEEENFFGELELYTLADDNYTESDEALSGLELMPLHITDFSISVPAEESWLPKTAQDGAGTPAAASTEEVQTGAIVQEAGTGRFPLILAAAGAFFLLCGVLSCRLNNEL